MNTFEQILSDTAWTEVLNGGDALAFDCVSTKNITVLFTETASTPSAATKGNLVQTYHSGWDFEVSGMQATVQRIWLKGNNTVRGIR